MDSLTFVSDICSALKTTPRTGWVRCSVPRPESLADHMHRCAMCALLVSQPPHPSDDYSAEGGGDRFHPADVDQVRLLRMAVTHDLCESLAGDVTPYCDGASSRREREERAMAKIRQIVGDPLGEELCGLWREYEEQVTVEAIYCRDIDKFEMVVQAYEYERDHLLPRLEAEKQRAANEAKTENGSKENAGPGCSDDERRDNQRPKAESKKRGDVQMEPLRSFFVGTNSTMRTPLFRRLDRELRDRRQVMLKEKGWDVADDEQQQ